MTLITVPAEVIGPYSPWPCRRSTTRARAATGAGIVLAAAFVHCVVPML